MKRLMLGLLWFLPVRGWALQVQYPLDNYAPGSYDRRIFGCCSPRHLGEDHAADPLTPVYAIADGQILPYNASGPHCRFGMVVIIEHTLDDGSKFVSLSGHLSNREGYRPRLNGTVRRGEIIGYVGHSGGLPPRRTCLDPPRSYDDENGDGGSHLHFAIRLAPAPRRASGAYEWIYPGYAGSFRQDVDFDSRGNPHGGLFTNPSRFLERLGVNDSDHDGYTVAAGDCNDTNAAIYPGTPEICDGVDNNCVGGADETFRGIGAASLGNSCAVGLGVCVRSGTMVCTADHRATVCSADPGFPTPEICDNLNNDCDCEGLDCRCGASTISCLCIGLRCTELTDEDFRGIGASSLGNSCTVGLGICANTGAMVCAADHRATVCNADSLPRATTETCNGLDDDCDGRTDEIPESISSCNDFNLCTTDTCSSGVCVHTSIICNDTNLCTDNSCDSARGCMFTPNTLACDDRNPCTVADRCSGGSCAGTPMTCTTPPSAVCQDSATLRTYAAVGTCTTGVCTYTHIDTACDDGDACTADSCSSGRCMATPPVSCITPPPTVCVGGTTLRTYTAMGTCSSGTCIYLFSDSLCVAPEHAIATCTAATCGFVCNRGYESCVSGCCTVGYWLPITTDGAPAGRASHTAIWTGAEMIVWGGHSLGYFGDGKRYDPSSDGWRPVTSVDAPAGRTVHVAVWTGREMIVWGGSDGVVWFTNGGRYDPLTDTWSHISVVDAPVIRSYPSAVWTGEEMIIWGGGYGSGWLNTGGRYNPLTDTWRVMSTAGILGRQEHATVWTGTEMLVWGGYGYTEPGVVYNPASDMWRMISSAGAPTPRRGATVVWTGREMVVWGGYPYTNQGGRYNPVSDSWILCSLAGAPSARSGHTAIWTGSEMIIWGGWNGAFELNNGGRYNPFTDSWYSLPLASAPAGRRYHTAIWTGSEMIIWGGGLYTQTGGRYTPP